MLKNAASTRPRTAGSKIATQTLLSGYLDVYAVLLPPADIPSDSGGDVHQLDSRNGAQDHRRGAVSEASAVESAADHLPVREESGGLVGGGRRRPRAENRQRDRRDGNGSSLSGHRRRLEGILQTFGRQRAGRCTYDREVCESTGHIPAESRGPRYPLSCLTHQDAVVPRRPRRDTTGENRM